MIVINKTPYQKINILNVRPFKNYSLNFYYEFSVDVYDKEKKKISFTCRNTKKVYCLDTIKKFFIVKDEILKKYN